MDDILFRHTAIATPNEKEQAFLDCQAQSEQNQSLVNDAKRFDAELESLLKVDVPEHLTDNILLEQSFALENERKQSNRWHIALAASIAFVIGISLPLFNNYIKGSADIGSIALQHIQEEYYFSNKIDENADNTMVNAKLASYGGRVAGNIGHVSYVNYCSFDGIPSLHLVMQGEKGKVTVFVVPDAAQVVINKSFNNQRMHGISERTGKNNIVIVGEKGESLQNVQQKLQQNIIWDI